MKKCCFIILLLILPSLSYSQIRDKNWVIGLSANLMTFEDNSINLRRAMLGNPLSLFNAGASCISDIDGNMALICNGCFLYDTLGNVIENGDSIVPSKILKKYFGHSSWVQQSIIIPKKDNQYYVFTSTISNDAFDDWDNNIRFRFDMLTYHIVESYGGGKGKVLEKGNVLMKDAVISHNRMTAVKHANGRDWWLIKPHQKEHIFYTFLVTPDKIEGPFEQKLNKPTIDFPGNDKLASVFGSSTFSRNGQFYAHTVAEARRVFVNRFDRCSGRFEEYYDYDIPTNIDSNQGGDYTYGVAFSPDSKLLYVNTRYNIWQIELADKSNRSVQFIHGPDTSDFFQGYRYPALALNDKIYIGNHAGQGKTMSYIEKPNLRGTACSFCAKCLRFEYPNVLSPPNMPYYALGALEGSSCDTIGYANASTDLVVPNSFTPNGDGLNDTWRIVNKNVWLYHNITVEECGVYNRWGNKVFTGRGLNFEWDGSGYAMDSSHYFIRYKLPNGETKIAKGTVNLIR